MSKPVIALLEALRACRGDRYLAESAARRVRPQLQAILAKHKPDIEKAIRAIVFWKGRARIQCQRWRRSRRVLLYEASRAAYGAAWPTSHQERLQTNVAKFEPIYYNAVVTERRRLGMDVPATNAELKPSMTAKAVERVIDDVDKIIGKHGFMPS